MQRALVLGAGGKNSQPHPLPVGISLSIGSYGSTALTMTLLRKATDREGDRYL